MPEDLGMSFFDRLRFGWGRNTVRILLDLDGSIVPEGQLEDGSYQIFDGNGYATWRVRNSVLEWLKDKREDERVELVWSSTWQSYANRILEDIGLEPIEWIPFDETYQTPGDWYKKDGLKLFLQEHSDPIVIVDDELPARFLKLNNPRILAIKPDSLAGISDGEIAQIEEFNEAYRQRRLT